MLSLPVILPYEIIRLLNLHIFTVFSIVMS